MSVREPYSAVVRSVVPGRIAVPRVVAVARVAIALVATALVATAGCAGDTAVGVVAQAPSTAAVGATSTSIVATTTTERAASDGSEELSRFGAAIASFTVEVDLKSSDIGFLASTAPFFVIGTLVSARPGEVRGGATVQLACESAPGTTVAGDCSRSATKRGVVLRFAVGESRRLRSAGSLPPLPAIIDVEFPGGSYATESNRRDVDKAIADVVALAPVGTTFAMFAGPSNFGGTYQVAGSASWGRIDAAQRVHALPTARREPWIDGSSTVASILAQLDERATR